MLSETKVKAAKPRPKPYKLSDGGSLFLLVTPSGGKLWRWNYLYDGKQKSMAFGAWPHVSIGDARGKRDEAYSVLAEGRDPSIVKRLKIEAVIEASRANGTPMPSRNGRRSTPPTSSAASSATSSPRSVTCRSRTSPRR